jgi:hypothetical protein
MGEQSSYTDPHQYVWSTELGDDGRVWAGAAITVTAPTGESTSWSVNDVFDSLEAVYQAQGMFGYPVTAAEQQFIDQCNSVVAHMDYLLNTALDVEADAQAVKNWLDYIAGVAAALFWIPVVGTAIAAAGGTIAAADLSVITPALNHLIQMTQQTAEADLKLRDLSYGVQQHSVALSDAQNTLQQYGQYALQNFWQAIVAVLQSVAHV